MNGLPKGFRISIKGAHHLRSLAHFHNSTACFEGGSHVVQANSDLSVSVGASKILSKRKTSSKICWALLLIVLGYSVQYLPRMVTAASNWYSAYQERYSQRRLDATVSNLSRRIAFAQEFSDAAKQGAEVFGSRPLQSAQALLQLAQKSISNKDYESAWKLLNRCEDDIKTWERWNKISD